MFGVKGGAHLHPLSEDIDLLLRQFIFGRHFVIAVLVRNHIEQQAFFRLIKVDGRTDVPTFQKTLAAGHPKVAFQPLLRTVAIKAILLQNTQNFLIKELDFSCVRQFLGTDRRKPRYDYSN